MKGILVQTYFWNLSGRLRCYMLLNFSKTGDLDWLICLIHCLVFDIVANKKSSSYSEIIVPFAKRFQERYLTNPIFAPGICSMVELNESNLSTHFKSQLLFDLFDQ